MRVGDRRGSGGVRGRRVRTAIGDGPVWLFGVSFRALLRDALGGITSAAQHLGGTAGTTFYSYCPGEHFEGKR